MPNWACGTVTVQGTKANILSFTARFIHEGEVGIKSARNGLFFHRSITNVFRKGVVEEITELFDGMPPEEVATFELFVNFAWSAASCIIDVKNTDECITLVDACKLDEVSVNIYAEENDNEEIITCDNDGNIIYECNYMPKYECPHCGNVMSLPSTSDADDFECCECGKLGLVLLPNDDDESEAT